MQIKDNKGITFITLVITIVVLAIITSVSVSFGINIMRTAKFENVETYLLLIQSKSKMLEDSIAIGEIDEDERIGVKQDGGPYEGWYRLSQADLNEIGVNKAKEEDGYYVDYEGEDVAYGKGISLDDVTFHKLSEIMKYRDNNK